ncbi:hypothetical protein PsYK624_165210 [Phanerochaete sordida]|uniref:Uncharacterized protein n=1 Tax=Phanerochaete sordida TaxID=48140 RepID=A0A9P3LMB1_9APHY|nr:hypothetical protein PsYK624_165210 [Phanerochaete sordida]
MPMSSYEAHLLAKVSARLNGATRPETPGVLLALFLDDTWYKNSLPEREDIIKKVLQSRVAKKARREGRDALVITSTVHKGKNPKCKKYKGDGKPHVSVLVCDFAAPHYAKPKDMKHIYIR